jgi:hypothetical protein
MESVKASHRFGTRASTLATWSGTSGTKRDTHTKAQLAGPNWGVWQYLEVESST